MSAPKLMCIHWINAVHTHTIPHDLLNLITYALYLHQEYIDIYVCVCIVYVHIYKCTVMKSEKKVPSERHVNAN